jgi:Family of unknown function (DUF5691)
VSDTYDGSGGSGWDGLATAALLGTQRRSPDLSALPGPVAGYVAAPPAGASQVDGPGDPALRLLDAAALATAYRRAGRRPRPAPPPLPVAPEDTAPQVGPAAAARLAGLLDGGDADLLTEWLRAVAAAGRRAPAHLLPGLLEAARRRRELAPDVVAVLGRRGEWLAGLRQDWARLVAANAAASTEEVTDTRAWTHGDTATRRRHFAGLRRTDPAAALDLLERSWLGETGEDRAALLAMLEVGLSGADEPLLERALDDRRRDVRETAALLLSRLPDSAFGGRMAERAGRCVAVQRRRGWLRIVVTPPSECDTAMQRDGVRPTPQAPGVGERAFWLRQVVAATPLRAWSRLLGRHGEQPGRAVSLPVDGDWADVLRAGWTDAAVRQRDADWALALLPVAAQDHVRLLDVVPEAERGAAVVTLLAALGLTVDSPDTAATALLATCPAPWRAPLADAVLAQLARAGGDPKRYGVRESLRLAALRLPPQRAAEVRRLALGRPDGSAWRTALTTLADTLALRHDMLEEIR